MIAAAESLERCVLLFTFLSIINVAMSPSSFSVAPSFPVSFSLPLSLSLSRQSSLSLLLSQECGNTGISVSAMEREKASLDEYTVARSRMQPLSWGARVGRSLKERKQGDRERMVEGPWRQEQERKAVGGGSRARVSRTRSPLEDADHVTREQNRWHSFALFIC